MQVSVETLKGLERKVTISVPAEKVEEEVGLRLRDLARKAKVAGFRPGKVPMHIVRNRFSDSVREDVARELVQSTLYEALQDNKLVPAGSPYVEPEQLTQGEDFRYSAVFEVFPDISIKELDNTAIELIQATVKDKDVDTLLEQLRQQHQDWHEVSREVAKGDKVFIDFKGFIDGEAFAGGEAENHELIIGSGAMIPGFEDALIGKKKDKSFDIKVTFPKDYNHNELAGKKAVFTITIHTIFEGKLPDDESFAAKFNIKEGGFEALRKDITANMTRELERKVGSANRERIFDKLLESNSFDVPKALVDKEIEHLKHDMYHRIFGNQHHDNEKIPDFPRELFEAQAVRRVHLGLLFSEYVKLHQLTADKARVDAQIEKMAAAYEDPEELRRWYYDSKEHIAEIEAMVIEEVAAEKMSEKAKISHKKMNYEEVMNPKKEDKETRKKDKESTGE